MPRWLQFVHVGLLLCVAALCVCACIAILEVGYDTAQAADNINRTLDNVNRPCGNGKPCGTLAEMNRTLVKMQDAAVTMQGTAKQSTAAIAQIQSSTAQATDDVHAEMGALQKTTQSATLLATQATADLQTANTTIQGWQTFTPRINANLATSHMLLASINGQVTMDGPLTRQLLFNITGATANLKGVTGDAYAEYNAWLHPPKCKNFKCKFQRYVLDNLPVAYHAIQAADAAHDLFSGTKIYGKVALSPHN